MDWTLAILWMLRQRSANLDGTNALVILTPSDHDALNDGRKVRIRDSRRARTHHSIFALFSRWRVHCVLQGFDPVFTAAGAILTLYMGLYPKPFTDVMHASVVNLLSHVAQSKL